MIIPLASVFLQVFASMLGPGAAVAAPAKAPAIEVDHIEGSTVYFKSVDGAPEVKPQKLDLFELRPLGSLRSSEGGMPYFLFSAKPCENCIQDTNIYAVRPNGTKPTMFIHPGKIIEARSHVTVLESRGFFGHCLHSRKGDVFVVFQKERIDKKHRSRIVQSVFIAEPGADYFDEQLLERRMPGMGDTLKLVKTKNCREIDGRNRLMVKRPLDLKWRSRKTEDQDEDDENSDDFDEDAPAATSPSAASGAATPAEIRAEATPASTSPPVPSASGTPTGH